MQYDYEANIFKDIENYRNLVKEQKEEISKRETIVDSLTESMVRKVKQIVLPYSDKMLHSASWGHKNITDPKPENKKMYKFVTKDLIERLFEESERKEVKFKNISSYGYDTHAYGFYFKYKGFVFEIKIPNIKQASKKNIYEIDFGQYQLFYQDKPSYWKWIKSSYDLDDIANAIRGWVSWKDDEF